MKLKRYLNESNIRLKRIGPGEYDAQMGRIDIRVYQAHGDRRSGYWSSTVTIGEYGDDDFEEQVFQGSTKAEVVEYISNFVKKKSGAIKRKPKRF